MAAVELLPVAATSASSGDFDVTVTQVAVITLKGLTLSPSNPTPDLVTIEVKDSNSNYSPVAYLTPSSPRTAIDGIGTYRVTRKSYNVACGVDRA